VFGPRPDFNVGWQKQLFPGVVQFLSELKYVVPLPGRRAVLKSAPISHFLEARDHRGNEQKRSGKILTDQGIP